MKIVKWSLISIIIFFAFLAIAYGAWGKKIDREKQNAQAAECMSKAELHYNQSTNTQEFKSKWAAMVLSKLSPDRLFDAPVNTLKKEQEICVKLAFG